MEFSGFQWDRGNRDKSRLKHGVTTAEAEQCFFNDPMVAVDAKHSTGAETRFILLGETHGDRKLFIAFAMRGPLVRVIGARPMQEKERGYYEEQRQKTGH